MKLPILILTTAVSLTASALNLRAETLISNLAEGATEAIGTDAGQTYYTTFKTGSKECTLDSVTLEHFFYDASLLPTVSIYEAADMTLVCSLGNPQALETGGYLNLSTFVSWSPSTSVTLKPGTDYLIAAGVPAGGPLNYFVITASANFTGAEGWQFGEDVLDLGGGLALPGNGHLICEINGTVVVAPPPPANLPPDISNARASVSMLWPPSGDLVPFTVVGVTDPDGDAVQVTVTGIEQDEPVTGKNCCLYDAVITGTTASVRADRIGTLNGRVYRIAFTASDNKPAGQVSGYVYISIPHSTSTGPAIDDGQTTGQYYVSTAK